MKNIGPYFLFVLLIAAAIMLACGSQPPIASNCGTTATNNGTLQSVTVCPASADAQNYPGGLVQFVAIGEYTTPPSPAVPKPVQWGACQNNQSTNGVTVSNTGLAQCSGASGTYTVWATAGLECNVIGPCGACGPTGRAQLTCP
jgi:hypothetical protein